MVKARLALNSPSSCFNLLGADSTGVCQHTWLLSTSLGLYYCSIAHELTCQLPRLMVMVWLLRSRRQLSLTKREALVWGRATLTSCFTGACVCPLAWVSTFCSLPQREPDSTAGQLTSAQLMGKWAVLGPKSTAHRREPALGIPQALGLAGLEK